MEIGLSVSPTRPWRTGGPFSGHATLTSGLVSYWKLNEVSGDRADSVGSNTLTDNNTVTSVAGMRSLAAQFTAANSEYLSSTGVVLPNSYSFSFWVNTNGSANYTPYIYASNGWANNTQIAAYTSGVNNYINVTVGDGSATVTSGNPDIFANDTWAHVFISYDASDNKVRCCINNGTTVVSAALGGTRYNTASPLWFARWDAAGDFYQTGKLDEVGLWSRVLTAQERTDLYNAGAGLFY